MNKDKADKDKAANKANKKQEKKDNSLTEKIESLEASITELTQALQQERADSVNIRRRHEAQLADLQKIVKTEVVRSLLPVVDSFERSLTHVPADLENVPYIQGIQGVVRQFEKTLENLGVDRIKTEGEVFDPELHEAVSMEDGDGDTEIVAEELQSGYKLGDEVIRHAMVRVKTVNQNSNEEEA